MPDQQLPDAIIQLYRREPLGRLRGLPGGQAVLEADEGLVLDVHHAMPGRWRWPGSGTKGLQ